jgi:hypothetical protein
LWLIKIWFSASTFVVKIATFAKPQNVIANAKDDNIHIDTLDCFFDSLLARLKIKVWRQGNRMSEW